MLHIYFEESLKICTQSNVGMIFLRTSYSLCNRSGCIVGSAVLVKGGEEADKIATLENLHSLQEIEKDISAIVFSCSMHKMVSRKRID